MPSANDPALMGAKDDVQDGQCYSQPNGAKDGLTVILSANYLAGDISASGGDGSSFLASFTVNANGSIDGTQVLNFGKEYTSSPTMNVLYRSSNISQEGSVSIIKVVSPGVNFLADGVLRVTGMVRQDESITSPWG